MNTFRAMAGRDRRLAAILLALGIVVGGGYALDLWMRSDRSGAREHAEKKRLEEVDQRFQQGVIMLHAKQYEHAVTAFHRVLQLAPALPEAHVNMGFALLGQKRYREARDFFDTATTLKPGQVNAYYGLAEAYEGLADYYGAVEAMEAYLHRAPADDPFRRRAESAVWEWRSKLGAPAPGRQAPAHAGR